MPDLLKTILFKNHKLFSLWGIPTYLHFTTKLTLVGLWLVIFSSILISTARPLDAVLVPTLICTLLIFAWCFVLMHEYGHAAMALRFGYPCKSITMYPIGGALQLEVTPYDYPWAEFLITVAGPLVNLVFVPIFYALTLLTDKPSLDLFHLIFKTGLQVNLCLLLFNAIPLFPMDGGRILRSILGMFGYKPVDATRLSWYTAIGVTPFVLFYFLFINFAPMIIFIVPFIIMAGYAELEQIKDRESKNIDDYIISGGVFNEECKKSIRFFGECQNTVYELFPYLQQAKSSIKEAYVLSLFKQIAKQNIDVEAISALPYTLRRLKTREIVSKAIEKTKIEML